MKLKDIINNIDLHANHSMKDSIYAIDTLLEYFDISEIDFFYSKAQDHIIMYWLEQQYQVDAYVGVYAIFLDGEFVCLGKKSYRKGDTNFSFTNEQSIDKLYNFLLTCITDRNKSNHELIDMEEEYGDGFKVPYAFNLSGNINYCIFNGEKVKVHREQEDYSRPSEEWSRVNITDKYGLRRIEMKELTIPYPIIGNEEYFRKC